MAKAAERRRVSRFVLVSGVSQNDYVFIELLAD